jgi:hypothetical protein
MSFTVNGVTCCQPTSTPRSRWPVDSKTLPHLQVRYRARFRVKCTKQRATNPLPACPQCKTLSAPPSFDRDSHRVPVHSGAHLCAMAILPHSAVPVCQESLTFLVGPRQVVPVRRSYYTKRTLCHPGDWTRWSSDFHAEVPIERELRSQWCTLCSMRCDRLTRTQQEPTTHRNFPGQGSAACLLRVPLSDVTIAKVAAV